MTLGVPISVEKRTGKNVQSQADELEERLIDFAVRVVKLSSGLPRTPAGKHIAGQVMRSGTSPAPNYGEARGAESHGLRSQASHSLERVKRNFNLVACDWAESVTKDRTAGWHHQRKQGTMQNIHGVSEDRPQGIN